MAAYWNRQSRVANQRSAWRRRVFLHPLVSLVFERFAELNRQFTQLLRHRLGSDGVYQTLGGRPQSGEIVSWSRLIARVVRGGRVRAHDNRNIDTLLENHIPCRCVREPIFLMSSLSASFIQGITICADPIIGGLGLRNIACFKDRSAPRGRRTVRQTMLNLNWLSAGQALSVVVLAARREVTIVSSVKPSSCLLSDPASKGAVLGCQQAGKGIVPAANSFLPSNAKSPRSGTWPRGRGLEAITYVRSGVCRQSPQRWLPIHSSTWVLPASRRPRQVRRAVPGASSGSWLRTAKSFRPTCWLE